MYKTKQTAIKHLKNGENFSSKKFNLFRDNKEVVIEAVKEKVWALEFASHRLKDDKEVVLEAVKSNKYSIRFATKEIQQLCQDKDPIQTLEKAIMYDKMKAKLKPKAGEKPTQKLKI